MSERTECVECGQMSYAGDFTTDCAGCDPRIDTESSASRQHYIDTGRYLKHGEALEAQPARSCVVCGRRTSFGCIHTADGSAYGNQEHTPGSAMTTREAGAEADRLLGAAVRFMYDEWNMDADEPGDFSHVSGADQLADLYEILHGHGLVVS